MRAQVDTLKSIIREPYAWPGGYERFAITTDGGCLCHKCCKAEYHIILASTRSNARDGWTVAGQASAAETDSFTRCDHCGTIIIEEHEE